MGKLRDINSNVAQKLFKRLSLFAALAAVLALCACVQLPEEYIEKYEVTVYSAGANASGGGYYAEGKTVTIYAGTAQSGQQFKSWTSTNSNLNFADKNSVTTTFTMPAGAVTVTAEFETTGGGGGDGSYTVNVESIGNDATGGGSYYVSQKVTVFAGATPDGYRFSHWAANPSVTFEDDGYYETTSFTMISSNVTVTAVFERIYAVTVLSAGTNASNVRNYAAGDEVNISAGTAPDGQEFGKWTVTTGNVTLNNPNQSYTSFIMPTNAVTVTAEFVPKPTFAVTVIAGTGATGNGNYWQGAKVSINAGTAPIGQVFHSWKVTSDGVTLANTYSATTTFTMPENGVTVTATFLSTFTDSRDGKTYKKTTIGGKTWMVENLNFTQNIGNSECYGDTVANCDKYGRLYDWASASTVCPTDWHLPTALEWDGLQNAVSGSNLAGAKLKAAAGWSNKGNGTDDYGFSALPGGYRYSDGSFKNVGNYGYWWTATEYGGSYADIRSMSYNYDGVNGSNYGKSYGFSVRCVQND